MSRVLDVRRSLALTSVLVVATWSVAAGTASADPASSQGSAHQGHGTHGTHQTHDTKTHGSTDSRTANSQDHKSSGKGDHGTKGDHGDPAGNNGTVKIAPLGEMDGIPNNSPHPGCDFQIEWYGYDEGSDVVSTVTFAMQAPTKDVGLTVDGPSTVFVGGDPATGAGTPTGLDGTQAYTLSFDGAPHPQQGYHVKLTVATPRSKGNDTKTKVFWVAPCDTETTTTGNESGDESGDDTSTDQGDDNSTSAPAAEGEGQNGNSSDLEVLGTQASTGDNSKLGGAQANAGDNGVPTAVDAGENGQSAADWIRSPLPLLVIALGAALAAVALVARRRSRVGSDS